jgi:hypothetical protein
MNTAIYSASGGSAGVGFAIPVDTLKSVVTTIIAEGKVVRPALGLSYLDGAQARAIGFVSARRGGVLVLDVPAESPAAAGGIRGTLRLDPSAVASSTAASTTASTTSSTNASTAATPSASASSSLSSSASPPPAAPSGESTPESSGSSAFSTNHAAGHLRSSSSSELQRALGLAQLGDVIQSIDGQRIKNEKDLFKVLEAKRVGDNVTVQVLRTDLLPDDAINAAASAVTTTTNVAGAGAGSRAPSPEEVIIAAAAAAVAQAEKAAAGDKSGGEEDTAASNGDKDANASNASNATVVAAEDLFALGQQRVATLVEKGLARYTVELSVVLGEKPESPLSSGIGLGREEGRR